MVRTTRHVILAAHSKHSGKVPDYKFETNDGFIVDADEAKLLSQSLRVYATHADQASLNAVSAAYVKLRHAEIDDLKVNGLEIHDSPQPLDLTLPDYKAWILKWAAYNEVASHHGGYEID